MGRNESHNTIYRLTFILLYAAWFTFPFFIKGDGCRIIQFKEQKRNVALANHVIRSEQVLDRDICELKCYQEPNCVSYNYGSSGDGHFVCELSNKTHLQVPSDDLLVKDEYIYSPITDNTCQSSPCANNSTCQAGFGVHGYRCIFPEVNCRENCNSEVDECIMNTHNCSPNADCSNAMEPFQCTCKSGYTGDGYTCEDFDECAIATHGCSSDADCSNAVGSFQCTCKSGYTGDGNACEDVDECTTATHDCSSDADCSNSLGSFQCLCKSGYTGDGRTCQDVDECTVGTHNCSSNANCANVMGSFQCTCKPGYTGDGETCQDVDECTMASLDCSSYANCSNSVGSFQCACKIGYTGDGKTCADVDECAVASHECSPNANCSNDVGSFQCTCKSGYTGDGNACEDVDECTIASHDCSPNANCSNDVGSFHCACKTGYTGDGKTCEDDDECTMNTHDCPSNANCSNIMGSFQCACKSGYTGDGKSCQDLDECATATHRCSTHADCSNDVGSYQCTCNYGYSGDGKTCHAFGSTKEVPFSSCKSLSSFSLSSGVYWLDIDGGSHDNAFKAYCEMETDGGNWTLVWSYTFTNYESFSTTSNAVTPRPTWDVKHPDRVDVLTSNTPPLNETDFNAIEFSKWTILGKEVLIKSNINNWIICSGAGSLPQWKYGNCNCRIAKSITVQCPNGGAPAYFGRNYDCGPAYKITGGDKHYYYFDGCTGYDFPAHDPCGSLSANELKNIQNPHGNVFIR